MPPGMGQTWRSRAWLQGIQERQDMPEEPDYPGEEPIYDGLNPENDPKNWGGWEHKNMFYIEDKDMTWALYKLFPSILSN